MINIGSNAGSLLTW